MPTAYTSQLRLALPATGEDAGTWGTIVNQNITAMLEQAITGAAAVVMPSDADYTLTANSGASDQARCIVLYVTSSVTLTAQRAIIVPTGTGKPYMVFNNTTGGQNIVIKTSGGSTTAPILQGTCALIGSTDNGVTYQYYSPLTVANSGSATTAVTANNLNANNSYSISKLTIAGTSGGTQLSVGTSSGNFWQHNVYDSATGFITFFSGGASPSTACAIGSGSSVPFYLYSSNINRVQIAAAGNVTISAPSSGTMLNLGTSGNSGEYSGSNIGTIALGNVGGLAGDTVAVDLAYNTFYNGPAANFQSRIANNVASYLRQDTNGFTFNVWNFTTSPAGSTVAPHAAANINPAGNVTINAPSSGTSLNVVGLSGSSIFTVGDAAHTSFSITPTDGGNTTVQIGNSADSNVYLGSSASIPFSLMSNNTARLALSAAGNVTINAPTSGTALTVSGVAGQNALSVVGGNTATSTSTLYLGDPSSARGTEICFASSAASTTAKYLRVNSGSFQIINNAYTTQLFTVDDSGNGLFSNNLTVSGGTVTASTFTGNAATATTATTATTAATANALNTGNSYTVVNLTATGTVQAATINATSDAALKADIRPIPQALDMIAALRGVQFNWVDTGLPSAGLIAQDVQAVLPEAVSTADAGHLTLNYNAVVGVLVEAVKKLTARVEYLEASR